MNEEVNEMGTEELEAMGLGSPKDKGLGKHPLRGKDEKVGGTDD